MPKYKVTVVERYNTLSSKIFDAVDIIGAEDKAYADASWTDLDGWEEIGNKAGESDIDDVMEVEA